MKENGSPGMHLLKNILHGVILTDLRGHILFWNKATEGMLGYSSKEVLGKPVYMLYAEEDKRFKEIMQKCANKGSVHGRWNARHKNGTKIWLDVRPKLTYDEQGDPELCLITLCNIGKLKSTESRLKKNRAINHAIFDTSEDAIITVNEEGRIQTINRSVHHMFGYKSKELIEKKVEILMPFPHNLHHNEYMEHYLETGNKDNLTRRELQAIKKDGTIFPIELSISEVRWEGKRIFAAVIKDISERRELEKKVLEIGDEERRKIGRELHDGLGQMLTGIRMLSEGLARKLAANAIPGADEVKEISELIYEADEYTRRLSRGMVLVDLEKRGLSVALENLCRRTSKLTGSACKFFEKGKIEIEKHQMAIHLYRIAQEAINNAVKHGNAKNIVIRLSSNDHHTALIIEDDGCGFNQPEAVIKQKNPDVEGNDILFQQSVKQGAGLHIMRHRATIMGGFLEVVRKDEKLTLIRCVVPNNLEHF